MESIRHHVLSLHPGAEIAIVEMCTPSFNRFVLKFRPDVILTFPFTCTGFATWYYVFKLFFKCKIICLRAEGIVDFGSEYNIQFATGFDRYGKHLVDYELFWGRPVGEVIGRNLLKQSKLSSMERVRVVGYPRLESYFNDSSHAIKQVLSDRIAERISRYPKRNIIFFVSGFHFANYSRQDLFDARDLDAENRLDHLLEAVDITKRFRQAWIERVVQTASDNPEMLIMLKKHPIEKKEDYITLEQIPNVLYIYEDVEIHQLIPYTGLFLHYGSTSLVDSYLSHVPSVYVYTDDSRAWYSDMGWPSSRKIHVAQIPDLVKEHRENGIPFVMTNEIRTVLINFFDIEEGKAYTPSRNIAEIIVSRDPAQQIPLNDIYLWKSFMYIAVHSFRPWLARTIKKILGMDPNEPLIKKQCPW